MINALIFHLVFIGKCGIYFGKELRSVNYELSLIIVYFFALFVNRRFQLFVQFFHFFIYAESFC